MQKERGVWVLRTGKPLAAGETRPRVMRAYRASHKKYSSLYKKLAEQPAKRKSHAKEPSPSPGACLLVVLASEPKLAFARECPAGSFRMGGRDYRDQGYGDWTGFYHWLRSAPDTVIGVRYWPFENTRFLADLSLGRTDAEWETPSRSVPGSRARAS